MAAGPGRGGGGIDEGKRGDGACGAGSDVRGGRAGGSGAAGLPGMLSRNEGIAPLLMLPVTGVFPGAGGWVECDELRRLVP